VKHTHPTSLEVPPARGYERGQRVSALGLGVNLGLAVIKLIGGLVGNSFALVADAAESVADVGASLLVWRALSVAARPADREHPYGHGKAEALAALLVALLLFAVAAGIAVEATRYLLTPHQNPAPFTLVVLIGVIVVKESLYWFARREGDAVGSQAVAADAWHHRSDAITSVAAGIGIAVAIAGGPGWEGADDAAALVAAGFIAYNGARLLRRPLGELMDAAPGEIVQRVQQIATAVPGVVRVEKVLARKSGLQYWVDMHVEVDPQMSVRAAHTLAHQVKDEVQAQMPRVQDVLIHVEPAGAAPPDHEP
jgi:cation diffusion facilitator family transporter